MLWCCMGMYRDSIGCGSVYCIDVCSMYVMIVVV